MGQNKIVSTEELSRIREELGSKTVVMCHGVYDLLHYGHIEHLREAKSYGDILVVSVTSEPYVNKGPDRPYFDDRQRTEFLASLEFVDYVVLSNEPTALTNIKAVRPNIYVKGQEFQSGTDGVTGHVAGEIEAVERLGGVVRYTQGEVYSSSKLLNNYFGALPENAVEYSKHLLQKYGDGLVAQINDTIERLRSIKTLVVGDIIIDDYVFCVPQGLTSKDSMMSTRFENDEEYLGGALAIARHLVNFCPQVELLSMMSYEDGLEERISRHMSNRGITPRILKDKHFVTPVKRRYVKQHPQRGDIDKLFSINYLNTEEDIQKIDYEPFYRRLDELLPGFDLVVVCDYGHGLLDARSIDILQKKSRFMALNCQTNSSNYGLNLITKYQRADAFTLDEKEIGLALQIHGRDKYRQMLEELRRRMGANWGWLTVGSAGAVCSSSSGDIIEAPALTLSVSDTVGAGDAFYALASLSAVSETPADIATLLANAAGAMKSHIIGNRSSVKKKDFQKFVKTVLNV